MTPTARARRRFAWLAPVLLAFAPLAGAADIGNLYEVSVPVQGSGEAADRRAFGEAMGAVLVRVTGRRDAPGMPALAPLVQQPQRYIRTYRRVAGGLMAVSFDGNAVEQAVAAAGLPFWGGERPLTMVWLVGSRGQLVSAAASPERRAVDLVAAQRGLPLAWPVGDALDSPEQRAQQASSGNVAALVEAAARYGADGVLIGRPADGGFRWTFASAGQTREVRGPLEEGVHLAADQLAARLAVAGGASRRELAVEVGGVGSAAAYAEVGQLLAALEPVRSIAVREVRPDAVLYAITVRGDEAGLRRAIAATGRLVPAGTSPAGPVFRYQP
ncbi:MAG: DUF2066 domain-containing protein [Steroidobacteraceae bacterium]|jgi:hypothetical protein|nr:DUF2066 domain-containing protein [Steroidobacteraceae bacterium]